MANALRFIGMGLMALSVLQIIFINIKTYQLRHSALPTPQLLWYHILLISLREIVMGTMLSYYVYRRYTSELAPNATLPLFISVGVVGNAAFWIVGKVVRARAVLAARVGESLGTNST